MNDAASLVLLGLFATSFVAYFSWLGVKIIDIRERIVKVEMNIESLLGTRAEQKIEERAETDQRLTDLESHEPSAMTTERPESPAVVEAKFIAADAADETAAAATDKAVEVRQRAEDSDGIPPTPDKK